MMAITLFPEASFDKLESCCLLVLSTRSWSSAKDRRRRRTEVIWARNLLTFTEGSHSPHSLIPPYSAAHHALQVQRSTSSPPRAATILRHRAFDFLRGMAETHVNVFGGSPLNRLSWLRTSTPFLSVVLASPEARWVLLKGGEPLVRSEIAAKRHSLARLSTSEVKPLLGAHPVFGQGKEPGAAAKLLDENDKPISTLEALRLHGPSVVFLGLHETEDSQGKPSSALPSSDFSAKTDPQVAAANISGTAYFGVDVSELDREAVDEVLESAKASETESGVSIDFVESRSVTSSFDAFDAAVFAEARSMLDWNTRYKFCPGCGSPAYSLWAGWKLGCSSLLPWAGNTGKNPCPSGKGLHNYTHPRTDPVVIMAVTDESGENILLGRNKRFPAGFYSTLAGFVEPGESFEDTVKREIWEEVGVRVHGVSYHSGQPYPYPASLMLGFYAIADASQPIRVDLDNEIVDARWFSRAEVQAVLAHEYGASMSNKVFDDDADKDKSLADAVHAEAPPFKVPQASVVGGVLIRDWASGRFGARETV